MDDQWLLDHDVAAEAAKETQHLIQVRCAVPPRCATLQFRPSREPAPWLQERNLKYTEGGPEASRITATSRRKLGTLGSLLDGLRSSLESPQSGGL